MTNAGVAGNSVSLVSRLRRGWTALDSGWKSALLGLLIVGLHITGVPT